MTAPDLTGLHRTAFSAAALRAAHTLAGQEPRIFVDDLALALTGMPEAEVLALGARVPPASSSTCVVRSRYTEDRLEAARARLAQYVVLGAGLDSYALRMGARLGSLTVFELDDPPFQQWKRQRVAKLGLTAPAQLRFVPCDFETTSIAEALAAAAFDANAPCFVSWLGVTQYLTREAIEATL
ncbi:MAG: class I SAM-dependent methyltransferase, partial [Nevskiales bacterium]